MSVYMKSQYSS